MATVLIDNTKQCACGCNGKHLEDSHLKIMLRSNLILYESKSHRIIALT